ncbi:MAG: LysM peptidoglycan-binding domain-containing M23 family metallopeptidase [bacterium]|nr:LysM peptidoglycan-binding domain-containing M23 family metallopeptidase [bacterium]
MMGSPPRARPCRPATPLVARRALVLVLAAALVLALATGCAGGVNGNPGVIHHVARGENLYRIGLRYGVPAKEIARVNGIRDVTELRVGQRLFIPKGGGKRTPNVSAKKRDREPRLSGNTAEARRRAEKSRKEKRGLELAWPVKGKLSSKFGRRWGRNHEGIDISAPTGTPIVAAEAGRVTFAGRKGAYGKVVIVKHAGRYRTLYAHASKLVVRSGQFVERGQKIAEVGSTGRSTAPHLHFEVVRAGNKQNPLGYLP